MRARDLVVLVFASACGFSGASSPSHGVDAASGSADASSAGSGDSGPCVDSDGDTICDSVDQCPGQDDRIDIDGDGIPDCKDDWLCGPTKPNGPSQPLVVISGSSQWSADHNHIADAGNVVNVKAGTALHIQTDWLIRVSCGGGGGGFQTTTCTAQLELGFDVTGRDRCVFDGTVQDDTIKGGSVDDMVTIAPTPSGASAVYELRFHIGRRSSCGTSGWDGNAPGSSSTWAKLCIVK